MLTRFVAIALIAGSLAASNPAGATDVGEVCVQQNGAFGVQIDYQFSYQYRVNYPLSYIHRRDSFVAVGQTVCQTFWEDARQALIIVHVYLGVSNSCYIDLNGKSGRVTATVSGSSLLMNLDCPK